MSNLSDFIGADPQGIIKTNASAAFVAGDVMINNDTGKPTVLNTALGLAFETNATEGPQAIKAAAGVEGTTDYGASLSVNQRTLCMLGNGDFATVYSGQSGTVASYLNVRVTNKLGANQAGRIVVSTDTAIGSYRIAKLNSTQMVVAWVPTGNNLKFAILNNDGTIAVAATTVSVLNTNTAEVWNMAVTASGQVVFAYHKVTSSNFNFSRYNASGALQGSETTVEAAATPTRIAVLGCANGDFVVSYRSTGTAYKFARYNASGVIQGALVTLVTTGSVIGGGDYSNGLIELANGNIVFATPGAGDPHPDVHIYTSANVFVKTIDYGTATLQGNEVPCLTPSSDGFVLMSRKHSSFGTGMWFYRYTSAGVAIVEQVSFGALAVSDNASSAGAGVSAVSLGSSGFAVLGCYYHSSPVYELRLATVNNYGVLVGAEIVLRAASSIAIFANNIAGDVTSIAVAYKTQGTTYQTAGFYNVVRKSVLGVAQNSGAADAQVLVATKGSYTINQSVDAGGVFDGRTATIPGTRGMVAGTSAVLFGLQP